MIDQNMGLLQQSLFRSCRIEIIGDTVPVGNYMKASK